MSKREPNISRKWQPPGLEAGNLKRGDDGYYHLYLEQPGKKMGKWLNTRTRDRDDAIRLIQTSGVERIKHLALAGEMTQAAMLACSIGVKADATNGVKEYITRQSLRLAESTVDDQELTLKSFFRQYLGPNDPIALVTEAHVYDFVNMDDAAAGTKLIRLHRLRGFFRWAQAKGYIVGNPAALVEVNFRKMSIEQIEPRHYDPITEGEYVLIRLMLRGYPVWHDMTVLAWCTGLRLGDAAGLEWASLRPEGILVYPGKTKHKRLLLPFGDPLINRPELQELLARLKLLPQEGRYVWPEHGITDRSKRSMEYIKLLRQMGIQKKGFHGLRVAFARRLEAAGKTIYDIAVAMGHGDVATTAIYLGREQPQSWWKKLKIQRAAESGRDSRGEPVESIAAFLPASGSPSVTGLSAL